MNMLTRSERLKIAIKDYEFLSPVAIESLGLTVLGKNKFDPWLPEERRSGVVFSHVPKSAGTSIVKALFDSKFDMCLFCDMRVTIKHFLKIPLSSQLSETLGLVYFLRTIIYMALSVKVVSIQIGAGQIIIFLNRRALKPLFLISEIIVIDEKL